MAFATRKSLLRNSPVASFLRFRLRKMSKTHGQCSCTWLSRIGVRSQPGNHTILVRMLISEVSVRCTGHLFAISGSRERCSAVTGEH